ncbi:competence type IV pilus assembly protein ComGB [Bacillus nakamurai]|uniref:Competence protein ComG n=1 Tax=Bacillus nakamurai TaxID=1793963 RepID=A0A150F7T5_9BACI|nr:competence type IV pilus assembly protein ComGB [Bacillus nakamurai]KXZ18509.1 competence protein ComG [Bacillus nakamurai]MED1229455.1 competence type IV pilus assembly protein ComGB [Bacillus nakamurai]
MKRIKKTWPLKDQANLLKRLGEMTEKGYSLIEGLRLLELQLHKRQLAEMTAGIRQLREGDAFYQVLQVMSFHKEAVSICYFAEKHGELPAAMKQSGELLQRKLAQTNQIRKMLRYPMFLIFSVCVMFYLLQSMIIPQFSGIYQSMNMKTSRSTALIFAFFQHFHEACAILIFFAFIMFVYYLFVFRKKSPQDKMLLFVKIPLIGKAAVLFNSYFFSLQLSSLLKSGLSIYDSLTAFKEQSFLPFYRQEAENIIERLKAGETIESALYRHPCYENDFAAAVSHGQLSGQLHRELFTYSQFMMERLEQNAEKYTGILQPVIYGVVAGMILIVYLSMLMPMYQMMNQM